MLIPFKNSNYFTIHKTAVMSKVNVRKFKAK